jgi:hypothetical protein
VLRTMKVKYLLILFLLVLLAKCRKDEKIVTTPRDNNLVFRNPPPLDTCPYLPPSLSGSGYTYSIAHPFCSKACFNPKNGAEFVYLRDNQIYIFDTLKNQSTPVFVSSNGIVAADRIIWSTNGWIFFNNYNYTPTGQIWRIKRNGDSLMQVTKDGEMNQDFAINNEGTRIAVGRQSSINNQYYIAIVNISGKILDTVKSNLVGGYMQWSPDDTKLLLNGGIAGSNFIEVSYYDFKSKAVTHFYTDTASEAPHFDGFAWLSDSKNIITISDKGIYRVNSASGKVTQLKSACSTRFYLWVSVSPDSKKFLCAKNQNFVVDHSANTAIETRTIWSIDVDGWNEHKFEIK